MRILIPGMDGYLGWQLSGRGHDVAGAMRHCAGRGRRR